MTFGVQMHWWVPAGRLLVRTATGNRNKSSVATILNVVSGYILAADRATYTLVVRAQKTTAVAILVWEEAIR